MRKYFSSSWEKRFRCSLMKPGIDQLLSEFHKSEMKSIKLSCIIWYTTDLHMLLCRTLKTHSVSVNVCLMSLQHLCWNWTAFRLRIFHLPSELYSLQRANDCGLECDIKSLQCNKRKKKNTNWNHNHRLYSNKVSTANTAICFQSSSNSKEISQHSLHPKVVAFIGTVNTIQPPSQGMWAVKIMLWWKQLSVLPV